VLQDSSKTNPKTHFSHLVTAPGWWTGVKCRQNLLPIFFSALALAVIFVYIVLAAQFESFINPFAIMLVCRCR